MDIDGVIVDTPRVFLDYIEKITGKKFSRDQVTSYFFHQCLDIDEEVFHRAMKEMIDDCIWGSISFYDGALEALRKAAEKHRLYIVTSRPESAVKPTLKWLKDWKIKTEEVVFTSMDSKLSFLKAKKIDLDYFIEDRLEFAVEIAPAVKKVFLVDRPWNRQGALKEKIARVPGLKQAFDIIEDPGLLTGRALTNKKKNII